MNTDIDNEQKLLEYNELIMSQTEKCLMAMPKAKTYLVVMLGAWGRGKTLRAAYDNCIKAAGKRRNNENAVMYQSEDDDISCDRYGFVNYSAAMETEKTYTTIKDLKEIIG